MEEHKELEFPDIEGVVTVPLFLEPTRATVRPVRRVRVKTDEGQTVEGVEVDPYAETDDEFAERLGEYRKVAHVKLRVQLLPDAQVRALSREYKRGAEEEKKMIRELRKQHSKEDWPDLYEGGFETDDGRDKLEALYDKTFEKMLRGLIGCKVGSGSAMQLTANITEHDKLIALIRRPGWERRAAQVCMGAQRLTGVQLLS